MSQYSFSIFTLRLFIMGGGTRESIQLPTKTNI